MAVLAPRESAPAPKAAPIGRHDDPAQAERPTNVCPPTHMLHHADAWLRPLADVAKLLGHADLAMVVRVYPDYRKGLVDHPSDVMPSLPSTLTYYSWR